MSGGRQLGSCGELPSSVSTSAQVSSSSGPATRLIRDSRSFNHLSEPKTDFIATSATAIACAMLRVLEVGVVILRDVFRWVGNIGSVLKPRFEESFIPGSWRTLIQMCFVNILNACDENLTRSGLEGEYKIIYRFRSDCGFHFVRVQ